MLVQAAPKTQPGGVHGALFKPIYQSEVGPESINMVPIPNAPKFRIKNKIEKPILPIIILFLSILCHNSILNFQ